MHKLADRYSIWPSSLLGARIKLGSVSGTLVVVLLCSNLAPAGAGTEVLGQLDSIQFRAENASTREVLEALSASFKLTYTLPPNINRNWNGLYSGSLHRILARILGDTDYIIKRSNDGIQVIVLRASETRRIPPAPDSGIASAMTDRENTVAPSARTAVRPPPAPVPNLATPTPPPLGSYLTDN